MAYVPTRSNPCQCASYPTQKLEPYRLDFVLSDQRLAIGAGSFIQRIVECYRDIDELLVMGGVIWGNNTANDLFVASHGVRTPDTFWKVVARGNGDAIAWIVPNTKQAVDSRLDSYLVTVADMRSPHLRSYLLK